MANVCESCRFRYPEPEDDGYYCEAKDDVIKLATRCGSWACKLSKIGTPEEFEHNIHRKMQSLDEAGLKKDLTVRDLAKIAKVSEVTMWRYIHRKAIPSIVEASVLADALGIDWRDVLKMCEPVKEDAE